MLGFELGDMYPKRKPVRRDEPVLKVRDLWPDGILEPISFDLYPGEILGLAGQLGSGTSEILGAMAGSTQNARRNSCTIKAKSSCRRAQRHDQARHRLLFGRPKTRRAVSLAARSWKTCRRPSLETISSRGIPERRQGA